MYRQIFYRSRIPVYIILQRGYKRISSMDIYGDKPQVQKCSALTLELTRGETSISFPLSSHLAVGFGTPVKGTAIRNSWPALTVMSFTLDMSSLGFSAHTMSTVNLIVLKKKKGKLKLYKIIMTETTQRLKTFYRLKIYGYQMFTTTKRFPDISNTLMQKIHV